MTGEASSSTLYGSSQSRFAGYLERREQRRPDRVARELRREVLQGLAGRVLEVGAGDGRSFEHYPPEVSSLLAVEPDPAARAAAVERARGAAVPIEVVAGVAEELPAGDGSVDAVVVMGVLCSVPDPSAALRELRRVLAEGGELRFWEHVRSGHAAFRLVQGALDRLFWTRALGGCTTTRDTEAAIR
ncbi:MAG TPA: class I SAM-dependent methyltransferase, partial [Gaiellaceae bacterium]|nr:class I SAM-dependent methyltransferase [Gaiellaceae bacterium]